MKRYYYCMDGKTVEGPISIDELIKLRFADQLSDVTQTCEEGTEIWASLGGLIATHRRVAALSRIKTDSEKNIHESNYVKQTLAADETVYYYAKVHWGIYVTLLPAFLGFEAIMLYTLIGEDLLSISAVFAVMILFPFAIFLHGWLVRKTTELAITNKRVITKTGLISRQTSEILLGKVESVEVKQGLIGRLMNFGTVTVRGTGGGTAPAQAISDPLKFRHAVQKMSQEF